MANTLKLTDYMPAPDVMDPADILDARSRLQTRILTFWPDLDTRPNSVFGDLLLTPAAIETASIEIGMRRLMSDMNLSNVAAGVVYNADFVTEYLKNFGANGDAAVSASGSVMVRFTTNATHVLDSDTNLTVGTSQFRLNAEEGNPVTVYATGTAGARRVLTRLGVADYGVLLPVIGTPGATIVDGDTFVHTFSDTTITSVTAAGSFDPGRPPAGLPELALRAQRISAAACLTSRSGIISYLLRRWPGLLVASATVTGDREMIRAGRNILGLLEGAADLFIRSSTSLAAGESSVVLTYNSDRGGWVGGLNLPTPPAFFAVNTGIFQVNNFNNSRGVSTVYARSTFPEVDSPAISFSKFEQLGILILDQNPTDFSPAYISDVTQTVGSNAPMAVTGQYSGSQFENFESRAIRIRLDSLTTLDDLDVIKAQVNDDISGQSAVVYFAPDNSTTPTKVTLVQNDPGYRAMLDGLALEVVPAAGTFELSDLLGFAYTFSCKGPTAFFSVNYLYDPLLNQVSSVIEGQDERPANVSLLARSLIPCYISRFTVNYRAPLGVIVDLEQARSNIFSYLNSLGWPNTYEESVIGQIMLRAGALSVRSVTKQAAFYPSLASIFVHQDDSETPTPRVFTSTLEPLPNDTGYGTRNVCYLIAKDTIGFNSTVI